MSNKNSVGFILILCAIFLVYGYVYERSYFWTLGLDLNDDFNWKHFLYSGVRNTLFPLLVILITSLVIKFFFHKPNENDEEKFIEIANEIGFSNSVTAARWATVISIFYWAGTIHEPRYFEDPHLAFVLGWILIPVLVTFSYAFYTCERHFIPTLFVGFFIATSFWISAYAVLSANSVHYTKQQNKTLIRDDNIVRITRTRDSFDAETKNIAIPLPLTKFVHSLINHKDVTAN